MVSRQIIRPSGQGDVVPHEHDATEISGTFNFLRVLKAIIDGNLTVSGFIRTGTEGNRIEIRPAGGGLVASFTWFTGAEFAANEAFLETGDLGGGVWSFDMNAPSASGTQARLRLRSDGVVNLDAAGDIAVAAGAGSSVTVSIDGSAALQVGETATVVSVPPGTEVARFTADGISTAARGDIAEETDNQSRSAASGIADLASLSITHTQSTSRRYRWWFQGFCQLIDAEAGQNGQIYIYDGSGNQLERLITHTGNQGGAGNANLQLAASYTENGTANGSVTRTIRFLEAGTAGVDFRVRGDIALTRFWVEDVGPALP